MSDQSSDPSRPFDPPAPPTAPPAPPPPPAPPVAPEPQRPDVPQYGEYAPADAPSNPYGVPGYPAAEATPPAPPTAAGPYGAAPYGAPTYGAPAYAPLGRQRKTWDLVLTIVLLALGAIGAFIGATSGLGLDQGIQQQYTQHGLGTYTGHNGVAIAVLAISHLVLYVIAVGLSILSLTKKRTTFWIPLVIGVIAAIFFWSVLLAVIFGDPTLMNALTNTSPGA